MFYVHLVLDYCTLIEASELSACKCGVCFTIPNSRYDCGIFSCSDKIFFYLCQRSSVVELPISLYNLRLHCKYDENGLMPKETMSSETKNCWKCIFRICSRVGCWMLKLKKLTKGHQ